MSRKAKRLLGLSLAGCLAAAAFSAPVAGEAEDPQSPEQASSSNEAEVSLADVLEGSSGVRVATMCTNCNVANVTMDGQTGARVQVLADGLPVVGGLGAIYLLSVLPQEGIASTEILRGAGTVLSGSEAAVGAVSLKTRDPETSKEPLVFATIDVGSLDWESEKVIASGRAGRWGGIVAATHSRTDESDTNGDGYNELGSARRTTAGGTGTFEIAKGSYLRLDVLGYEETQRDNKGGATGLHTFHEEDVDIQRHEGGLGLDYTFEDRSRLTVRTRYTARDQETTDSDLGVTQPYMAVDENAKLADARYERTLWDRHLFTVGVDGSQIEVAGLSWKGPEPEPLRIDDTVRRRGAYAQIELALPKRFDLTVGVRYDDLHMFGSSSGTGLGELFPHEYDKDRSRVQPRLRLAWKASQMFTLSLSAGGAMIAPPPVFERVCCGATVLPNNFVSTETSRNYLLDVDFVPDRWAKIRLSLFHNDYTDYLQKYAVFSVNWIPVYGNVNYEEFSLQGAELAADFRFLERLSFGFQWTNVQVVGDRRLDVNVLGGKFYELPPGKIINLPEEQGSAFVKWDDSEIGLLVSLQGQYTGTMVSQRLPNQETQPGNVLVTEFWDTPSFWTVNLRLEQRLWSGLTLFGGIDNWTDYTQKYVGNALYEYNWGPLRGRYYYAGAKFEL